jgi:hypothetical protein
MIFRGHVVKRGIPNAAGAACLVWDGMGTLASRASNCKSDGSAGSVEACWTRANRGASLRSSNRSCT